MITHCIWLRRAAIAAGVVLALVIAPGAMDHTSSATRTDPLEAINHARSLRDDPPLLFDERLAALATGYAQQMVVGRCACLLVLGEPDAQAARLSDDVRAALGTTSADVNAGLTIAWDISEARGVAGAAGREGSSGVLLPPGMALAGIGSALVSNDAGWLSRPMSGAGPDIDLAGYTIVVIVTASVGSGQ